MDSKGHIYVADSHNNRIQIFDSSGKYLRTLGTGQATSGNDGFNSPQSVFVDSKGLIYVADAGNHRIQIFPNLDDIEAAEKKRREEAEKYLGKNLKVPEPSNKKEELARDRFKIIWDDASRFLP